MGSSYKAKSSFVHAFRELPLFTILGFSLSWGMWPESLLSPVVGMGDAEILSVVMAFTSILLVLVAVLSRALRRWIDSMAGVVPLCVVGAVGLALQMLLGYLGYSLVQSLAAFLLQVLYQVYFMVHCLCGISRLTMRSTMLSLALWQLVLGLMLVASLFGLPLADNGAYLAVGIVANLIALRQEAWVFQDTVQASVENEAPAAESLRSGQKFPWRLLVVQFVFIGTIYALRSLLNAEELSISHAGFGIASIIVIVVVCVRKKPFELRVYYNASLVVLLIALALASLALALTRAVSGILADVSYVLLAALCYTVYGNLCLRFGVDRIRLLAVALAVECGGGALGNFVGIASTLEPTQLILILSTALAICFTCFFTRADFRTSWKTKIAKSNKVPNDLSNYYYSFAERCSALARQEGLSRREEEVLLLLVQRKSAQDIATELYISVPTVKTHTQNVYRKLKVHSRKELLASVGYPRSDMTAMASDDQ